MKCDNCGHEQSQHIYEEGACRPGFVCEYKCEHFESDYDPSPWCSAGHRTAESCDCGPIPDND